MLAEQQLSPLCPPQPQTRLWSRHKDPGQGSPGTGESMASPTSLSGQPRVARATGQDGSQAGVQTHASSLVSKHPRETHPGNKYN